MNHLLKTEQATLWNSSAGKGDFSSFKGTSFPLSGNHLLIISFYEIIFEIETLCIMTFSPHTLLFKFQKTLYLITTTYYLLPFTKYSWQKVRNWHFQLKIMHCQIRKLQAIIFNTCIYYFKHETLHQFDINLYNRDRKG